MTKTILPLRLALAAATAAACLCAPLSVAKPALADDSQWSEWHQIGTTSVYYRTRDDDASGGTEFLHEEFRNDYGYKILLHFGINTHPDPKIDAETIIDAGATSDDAAQVCDTTGHVYVSIRVEKA